MTQGVSPGHDAGGELVPNLMYFARALRAAGLPIGPGKVLDAIHAVRVVGVVDRRDFYWTLHSINGSCSIRRSTSFGETRASSSA
jgi:uncharacterized protein with von Willebrand factor type A (vWA) domain